MAKQQIEAPLPGVFYRRPSPDEPVYVEPGTEVGADEVIGLIEVMKQFTEVKAGVAGTIGEFLVDNEGVVGAGDPVADIEVT